VSVQVLVVGKPDPTLNSSLIDTDIVVTDAESPSGRRALVSALIDAAFVTVVGPRTSHEDVGA
jgi:hypothetical protein